MNNYNMLPTGTLLRGGTYRITKQLNSGGFGNTYVVKNVNFDETYAMKEFFMQGMTVRRGNTVSVNQMDNAEMFRNQKEKFKKEALRLRKLNHPNIVRIYDLFEENNTYYYIMDYFDGESLAERLKHKGAMTENEVLKVLESLLVALAVVHSAGFTHMDIKPGNIMQDRRGRIFLIDFGASKQMTSDEQRTMVTSTAMPYSEGYAPIEQVERKLENVGPWTDFYAVGATLYRLLTNHVPPSSSEIIDSVVNQGTSPFLFPSNISSSTQSLIKWLMQPGRKSRPQSVSEIKNRFLSEDKKSDIGGIVSSLKPHANLNVENTVFDRRDEVKSKVVTPSANINTKKTNSIRTEIPNSKSYIKISSEPSGAAVRIDGSAYGIAPGKFEVKPGKHIIMLGKGDGFHRDETIVNVLEGETRKVHVQLRRVIKPEAAVSKQINEQVNTERSTTSTHTTGGNSMWDSMGDMLGKGWELFVHIVISASVFLAFVSFVVKSCS